MILRELLEPADECADFLHGIGVASWPGKTNMRMVWHDRPRAQRDETLEMRGGFEQIALRRLAGVRQHNAIAIDTAEQRTARLKTCRHEHRSAARIVVALESAMGFVHGRMLF